MSPSPSASVAMTARRPLCGSRSTLIDAVVHAGLPCRMAHAPSAGADALRGRRERDSPRHAIESGDQSSSLGFGTHQGRQPSHIRRLGCPQLPEPRRRPRDALPQYARHRDQPELRDHRRHPSHIEPRRSTCSASPSRWRPPEARTVPSSTRRLGHKALPNQCDVFSKSKKFRLDDGVLCYLGKPVDDDHLERRLRSAVQHGWPHG